MATDGSGPLRGGAAVLVTSRIGAPSDATPSAPTAVATVVFTPAEPEPSDDELPPEPEALVGELDDEGEAAEQDEELTGATADGDPSWAVVPSPASEDDTPTLVVASPLAVVVGAPAEAHPAGELELGGVGVGSDVSAVAVPGAADGDDAELDELSDVAVAGDGASLGTELEALEDAVEGSAPTLADWLALVAVTADEAAAVTAADEAAEFEDAPLVPPAASAGEAAIASTTAAVAKERPIAKEQSTAEEQPSNP